MTVVPWWLRISGPSKRYAVKLSEEAVDVDNRDSEMIMMIGTMGLLDAEARAANMEPIEGVEASK